MLCSATILPSSRPSGGPNDLTFYRNCTLLLDRTFSITIRLNLNLEDCPGCKYLEYACTCEHANDDHKKDQKK